jgi:serine/threonine-protein kinase
LIGEALGNYRIIRQIGAGGMGVVYFAQHQLIGRRAAVKVLLPQYSRDATMVNRFFNEARTTTLIQHPGLVDIFDFGFHPSGAAYLVMEFLDGETLASRRKRDGRLPVWMADAIVRQMASAIGAAHQRGVVHRDIKPENIFLVPDRNAPAHLRVKVLDFGVAKLSSELGAVSNTSTGSMLGTPQYMSPEQCRGAGQVDHRSDIYAVGCILFELVTGRPVFQARGFGELLASHQRMPPPSLASIDRNLPPELDGLLMRMLAKRPEDRPQTLQDVEAALEAMAAAYGWEAYYSRRSGVVPMPAMQGMTSSQQRMFLSQGGMMTPVPPAAPMSMPAPMVTPPPMAMMTPTPTPPPTTTLGSTAAEVGAAPARSRRGRNWVVAGFVITAGVAGMAVVALHEKSATTPGPGAPVAAAHAPASLADAARAGVAVPVVAPAAPDATPAAAPAPPASAPAAPTSAPTSPTSAPAAPVVPDAASASASAPRPEERVPAVPDAGPKAQPASAPATEPPRPRPPRPAPAIPKKKIEL